MRNNKPILLLEDDYVDALTVKRALKELRITNPLQVAGNGEEGLDYLRDKNSQQPSIILLDLNMPRMNGIEFLQIVKQDDELRRIPVVVLTTSSEHPDKIESFNLGIAGYMSKPVDYTKFIEVIRTIDLYWTLSELP